MNAQRSRGVDFGAGGLRQRIKTIVPILIPLFVNAFNRAVDISTAMEHEAIKTVNSGLSTVN